MAESPSSAAPAGSGGAVSGPASAADATDRGDLRDFFTVCDPAHREFFSALMHDWREAGQAVGVRPPEVRLEARSTVRDADGARPCLFRLRADRGREGARIEMDIERWRGWLGEEATDACVQALAGMEGLTLRWQRDALTIIQPGHASGPVQQALRNVLVRQGRMAAEAIGV